MHPRLLAALLVTGALALAPAASADPAPPPPDPPALLWALPVAGQPTITRGFEAPPHSYAAGHRGVDLAAAAGAPVLAAGAGTIAFAGMVAGRPVVSIDHANGLRTTYEPVEPFVGAGRPVARGSPIGAVVAGHSGCPVDACLHWGLRRGETYLDPMALLRPPRVRLLPLSDR